MRHLSCLALTLFLVDGVHGQTGDGLKILAVPHIAAGNWTTTLTVYNPSLEPLTFEFRQANDAGAWLSDSTPFQVAPGDQTTLRSNRDFEPGGMGMITTAGEGVFTLSFQFGDTPSVTQFTLSDQLHTTWVLPNPQADWYDWFGIALSSIDERPSTAIFRAFGSGVPVAQTGLVLTPFAKEVGLSDQLWTNRGLTCDQVDMVIIETDIPIPAPISITGNQAQDRHLFFTATATQPRPYVPLVPSTLVERGYRQFGLNISDSTQGFDADFAAAQQTGMQLVALNLSWDDIEPTQGAYRDPDGIFQAISFYGTYDISVMLYLSVIDTVRRTTPDHLDALPFDSPTLIHAFGDLLDFVFASIPENVGVPGIAIGNEVDLYLSGQAWDEYISFFAAASDLVRTKAPGVKVGVTTTAMNTVFGSELAEALELNQFSDVIMLNLYPQNRANQVFPPDWIHQGFSLMSAAYPLKPIWLTEIGYQSGGQDCQSSELKQALFYHEFFQAWDQYPSHFPLVIVNWLNDPSQITIDQWAAYYGSSDPAFLEYLATLGLRHHDGTEKPAFPQLVTETMIRGW